MGLDTGPKDASKEWDRDAGLPAPRGCHEGYAAKATNHTEGCPAKEPFRGAGQGHQLFSMQTAGMPQLAHLYKLELANTAQTHSEA